MPQKREADAGQYTETADADTTNAARLLPIGLWRIADHARFPLFGRYRMQSAHRADFVASLGVTQKSWRFLFIVPGFTFEHP